MTSVTRATAGRTNWAGNYAYGAAQILQARTVEEIQQAVAGAEQVRALGSRHSFNAIADTPGLLVSLRDLPTDISVNDTATAVTVSGGATYNQLVSELQRQGVAIHNMASLPHISIAGAVATATHGSGDGNGNLATAVSGMDIVTSGGELVSVSEDETENFDGMVVGLGALGIVTRLTLRLEPSFDVRQDVLENVPWPVDSASFEELMQAGYSVSLFTDWCGKALDQMWVKRRQDSSTAAPLPTFGGTPAKGERHPLPGVSPEHCTPQRGLAGPWSERLPHFRSAFTPSNGDELQSEYLLPRENAVEAMDAMRSLGSRVSALLQVAELRTIAADDLWLSPNYHRHSVGLHFTWIPDQSAVERLLPTIEEVLAPLGARPHWGKVFAGDSLDFAELYPKLQCFTQLAGRLDPRHKFRNEFLNRTIFSPA